MAFQQKGRDFLSGLNFDLWLHFLNWILFGGTVGVLILLNEQLAGDKKFLLQSAAVISFINVFSYLALYKTITQKKPGWKVVFPILTVGALFFVFKFFGGILSPFFGVFLILLLLASLSHYYAGILTALIGLGDIFASYRGGDLETGTLLGGIFAYLAFIPISFIYGKRIAKLAEEGRRAAFLAERLTQEKSKEENLLASMADGVYAVDRDRRVVMFNKAAEGLTNLNAADVLQLHCYDVLKWHDEKGINFCKEGKCPIIESWQTEKPVRKENVYYTSPDKKTLSLSYSAAPIRDFAGSITGGIAIFRDVTKKKEVERMRNEFVSIASHEMRTPLFAIEGYLSLAQRINKTLDPKVLDYIAKARGSVISMSNLLKNLLSFSKIEEGKVVANIKDFDLKDIIKETINELKPKADAKNIRLEFKETTTGELGKKALIGSFVVRADAEKIKEVLLNLVDNGIKFTKEGGVFVTISGDAEFVKTCVNDTGPGIAKGDQARLFQKFYRVDNTFTREVGGTGLGLYLSREMVEMFGGKIWVESDAGKGAMFCFTLPRVKK